MLRPTRLTLALCALLLAVPAVAAPRRSLCNAVGKAKGKTRVAVLSAFPAELAPLVAAATITDTVVIDGRSYYLGTLAGVRVVLAMTGIGLVNAESTTQTVIDEWQPRAIVFSGVAPATETLTFETADPYGVETERFALAILEGRPVPTPPEDGVATLRVIEAIFATEAAEA